MVSNSRAAPRYVRPARRQTLSRDRVSCSAEHPTHTLQREWSLSCRQDENSCIGAAGAGSPKFAQTERDESRHTLVLGLIGLPDLHPSKESRMSEDWNVPSARRRDCPPG